MVYAFMHGNRFYNACCIMGYACVHGVSFNYAFGILSYAFVHGFVSVRAPLHVTCCSRLVNIYGDITNLTFLIISMWITDVV